MPLVRSIYRGLKQIFETVLSNKADMFQTGRASSNIRAGASGRSSSSRAKSERGDRQARAGCSTRLIAVFMPSTPNPTTGYLLYVPKSEVIELSMTVEEAAKLVISAGLVAPERLPVKKNGGKPVAAPKPAARRAAKTPPETLTRPAAAGPLRHARTDRAGCAAPRRAAMSVRDRAPGSAWRRRARFPADRHGIRCRAT